MGQPAREPSGGHAPAAGAATSAPHRPSGPRPGGPAGSPPDRGRGGLPRYGPVRRFSDWAHARADGRARLPSLEPGRAAGTPTLEGLAQDFLARSHGIRLEIDTETAPMHETAASLLARLAETRRRLDLATERLARWPAVPAEDQLALRRAGERTTATDVVAARRAREYEVQRRPLVSEEASLQDAITRLQVDLARTRSAVHARELSGATRVRRLHAQIMRRVSHYERHLVRHHPGGDRIGAVLAAQHPRVPDWVLDAEEAPDPAAELPAPDLPDVDADLPGGDLRQAPRPAPAGPVGQGPA